MLLALKSGWYVIQSGGYESEAGVCPLVAAAKIAGVWREGHAADGGPDWGSETEPSPPAFSFALGFDMYAEEAGIDAAVALVLAELVQRPVVRPLHGHRDAAARAA